MIRLILAIDNAMVVRPAAWLADYLSSRAARRAARRQLAYWLANSNAMK